MGNSAQTGSELDSGHSSVRRRPTLRRAPVSILFIHRSLADVKSCLQEVKRSKLRVRAHIVQCPEQFTARLSAQCYDLILAEFPISAHWANEVIGFLNREDSYIPLIFITRT